MTTWRIYGFFDDGQSSWHRVAAGLREGLIGCEQQVSVFGYQNIAHDLDQPLLPGYDADVGIFVGPPAGARMMKGQGTHKERWLMLAPNSSWLPGDLLEQLERTEAITGYLTPSEWGRTIIANYTELPVRVWRHGISSEFERGYEAARRAELTAGSALDDPRFRVLHLSSTQHERKSTHALVRAWVQRFLHVGVFLGEAAPRLTIVADGPAATIEHVAREAANDIDSLLSREAVCATVRAIERKDWDPIALAFFMRQYDFVCQPSRAEGFGMVPLEAAACGVPMIVTDGTGHDEHVTVPAHAPEQNVVTAPGEVVILTGADGPIDDGPGAMAPTVDEAHIAEALTLAYDRRRTLQRHAEAEASDVRDAWSWVAVTRWFLTQMEGKLP